MLEERDERFTSTGEIVEQPGEREEGPTSTDVTDKQISIGEAPAIVPQEERPGSWHFLVHTYLGVCCKHIFPWFPSLLFSSFPH
jgi:hypothetical protein